MFSDLQKPMTLQLLSRREFLTSSIVVGAGAILPSPAFPGQGPTRRTSGTGLIDVHHHIDVPVIGARGGGGGGAGGLGPWSAEKAVAEMDANGVATGIAFLGPVQSSSTNVEAARRQARERNEFASQVGASHPGRFGLFAALPLPDVEGSLREIEYALDTLKADGFGITTQYGELWLGDSKLRPIWEELHRRKAVVYVHPSDAPCCTSSTLSYQKNGIGGPWIEWPMNTARTILSLMTNGVSSQLPDVRFIFSHGGGVMPLLIERLAGFVDWPSVGPEKLKSFFPDGIQAEFRKFYFELAQAFAPVNYEALTKLVPTSHILFGTDYNRFPISHSTRLFNALQLSADIREAIGRGNAMTLLPRWK
jgi:predicted TIM-barrel fold metal-dependent hydrolase